MEWINGVKVNKVDVNLRSDSCNEIDLAGFSNSVYDNR